MAVSWLTLAAATTHNELLNNHGRTFSSGHERTGLEGDYEGAHARVVVDERQAFHRGVQVDSRGDDEGVQLNSRARTGKEADKGKKRKQKKREDRKTTLQVASLNLNGFGNLLRDHEENKWGRIYRIMAEHRIGVLLIQESHLTAERVAGIHKMFAKKIRILHSEHQEAPTQREGVAAVLNLRYVNAKDAKATEIIPGRALQIEVPCMGGDVKHLLCIYAPTSSGTTERKVFFRQLREYYEGHPEHPRPHMMAGDFNNVEDAIDRLPIGEGRDRSVETLDELKISLGLMIADDGGLMEGNKPEYSGLHLP